MQKNVTPLAVRQYTPEQIAEAQKRADQARAEIHAEGMAQGHKAAVHSERHRLLVALLIGVILGGIAGGWGVDAVNRGAMFSAGAVIDRALVRTVPDPNAVPLAPAPATRDPSVEYDRNAARARGSCSDEQLRAGIRRCGLEPPSAR